MFSEVLTRDEWLRVFDNIFSNHPAFLLCLVAAYCVVSRGPLLHCSEFDDFNVRESFAIRSLRSHWNLDYRLTDTIISTVSLTLSKIDKRTCCKIRVTPCSLFTVLLSHFPIKGNVILLLLSFVYTIIIIIAFPHQGEKCHAWLPKWLHPVTAKRANNQGGTVHISNSTTPNVLILVSGDT